MALKLAASRLISSGPDAGARWLRSPRPKRRAAAPRFCTGDSMRPDNRAMSNVPSTAAAMPVDMSDSFTADTTLLAVGAASPGGPVSGFMDNAPTCRSSGQSSTTLRSSSTTNIVEAVPKISFPEHGFRSAMNQRNIRRQNQQITRQHESSRSLGAGLLLLAEMSSFRRKPEST